MRFIWIKCMGLPMPQILYPDAPAFGAIIAEHRLTKDEEGLSLDDLAAKYPAPNAVGEVLVP